MEGAPSVGVVSIVNEKEVLFEDLVVQYEGLIKAQIKKLNRHKQFDELYQIGLIALWDAQKNFDPAKGYFASYAKMYVKGRLLTFLKKEWRTEQHVQTALEPEMIENIADHPSRREGSFLIDQLKPLLKSTELRWLKRILFKQPYTNRNCQKIWCNG